MRLPILPLVIRDEKQFVPTGNDSVNYVGVHQNRNIRARLLSITHQQLVRGVELRGPGL